jgi:hypothetical protein
VCARACACACLSLRLTPARAPPPKPVPLPSRAALTLVPSAATIQTLGRQYALHSSHVHKVEFTEDDDHVIVASADGVVSQWRLIRHNAGNYTKIKVHQFHPEGGVYQTGDLACRTPTHLVPSLSITHRGRSPPPCPCPHSRAPRETGRKCTHLPEQAPCCRLRQHNTRACARWATTGSGPAAQRRHQGCAVLMDLGRDSIDLIRNTPLARAAARHCDLTLFPADADRTRPVRAGTFANPQSRA